MKLFSRCAGRIQNTCTCRLLVEIKKARQRSRLADAGSQDIYQTDARVREKEHSDSWCTLRVFGSRIKFLPLDYPL